MRKIKQRIKKIYSLCTLEAKIEFLIILFGFPIIQILGRIFDVPLQGSITSYLFLLLFVFGTLLVVTSEKTEKILAKKED